MAVTTRTVTKNYRNRIPLNTPTLTKTNYSHYGWEDPNGTKFKTSDTIDLTRDITLTAVWGAKVTYVAASGDTVENLPPVSSVYISGQTIPATTSTIPSKATDPKIFIRWNNGSSAATAIVVDSTTTNKTYTAVWGANVTYEGNGSTSGTSPTTVPTAKGDVISDGSLFEKDGWSIQKWNTSSNITGTDYALSYTNSSFPSTNITLYAVWGPAITINYSANDGSFKDDQTSTGHSVFYNQQYTTRSSSTAVQYDSATRTFRNWNTLADGSGSSYNESTTYTMTTKPANNPQTLYAIWRVIVTYVYESNTFTDTTEYKNDDTIIVKSQSDTEFTLPTSVDFDGWSYNGNTYQADDTIEVSSTTSNITFTMRTVTTYPSVRYIDPRDDAEETHATEYFIVPNSSWESKTPPPILGWTNDDSNDSTVTAKWIYHPSNKVTSATTLYLVRATSSTQTGYNINFNLNAKTAGNITTTGYNRESVTKKITLEGSDLRKGNKSCSGWRSSGDTSRVFNVGQEYYLFEFLPKTGTSLTRQATAAQTFTLTAQYL
jgi:hypothetical protein